MARDSTEFAQQSGERAMQAATFGMTWAREFTEENFNQGKQTLDSFLRVSRKLTEELAVSYTHLTLPTNREV